MVMSVSDTNPDLAPVADSAVVTHSVPVIDLGGAEGMQDPATAARGRCRVLHTFGAAKVDHRNRMGYDGAVRHRG